ncbi:hypothetical protein [Undibacterium sp. WLHG33]|uniref:hypothetical protein n=1 Tax=Undibacterium sp. WLHG33 TaxID=3412482 RepID=UPI003C2FCC12
MSKNEKGIWVGVIPSTGVLIVFDPELQFADQKTINVYSVKRNLVREFDPAKIRDKVRTVDGLQREQALEKYFSWKVANDAELMSIEYSKLERLRIERERTIERHREFLIAHGYKYLGIAVSKKRVNRITHCWNCKSHLDNAIDVECVSCGWIVCRCGACGCGRQDH